MLPRTTSIWQRDSQPTASGKPGAVQLRLLLEFYFEEITIILYLRRQDRLAVSFHSTLLRGGSASEDQISDAVSFAYFDFAALIERWGAAFGPDRLVIALAESPELVDGSVVSDFVHRLGLPVLEGPFLSQNRSLSLAGQDLLRDLNIRVAGARVEMADFIRTIVAEADGSIGCGRGRRPREVIARNFVDRFSVGNEWIRKCFFPDRQTLFDTDFSEYPAFADPRQPEQMIAIAEIALVSASEVLGRKIVENSRLRAELGYYSGLVHLDAGRFKDAEAALGAGLEVAPERAQLWHVLGRVYLASGRYKEARLAIRHAIRLDPNNPIHESVLMALQNKQISSRKLQTRTLLNKLKLR